MAVQWKHKNDDSVCFGASKESGEWLCTPHDRQVSMHVTGRGVADISLEDAAEQLGIDPSEITPVPLEEFRAWQVPQDGSTSAEALRNHPGSVRARKVAEQARVAIQPALEQVFRMVQALESGGELEQVGWYCAGGHEVNHNGHAGFCATPTIEAPSLRFDDPCKYGVPVFVIKPSTDSPCETCSAHLEQCAHVMSNGGPPCCTECMHRT